MARFAALLLVVLAFMTNGFEFDKHGRFASIDFELNGFGESYVKIDFRGAYAYVGVLKGTPVFGPSYGAETKAELQFLPDGRSVAFDYQDEVPSKTGCSQQERQAFCNDAAQLRLKACSTATEGIQCSMTTGESFRMLRIDRPEATA